MKTVKKLMALVLASALALTLLTGCGGGGGGGGGAEKITIAGVSMTMGGIDNANTDFTKDFTKVLKEKKGIELTYSTEKAKLAQNYLRVISKAGETADVSPDEAVEIFDKAGIDITKEMIFITDKTVLTYQESEIWNEMESWKAQLKEKGVNVDYNGAKFGYTTATGGGEKLLIMVMDYTTK